MSADDQVLDLTPEEMLAEHGVAGSKLPSAACVLCCAKPDILAIVSDGREHAPIGHYLQSADIEVAARGGYTHLVAGVRWTADIDEALQFRNSTEALRFWKQESQTVPLRPDGKPNRPLTAFTVEVLTVEKARERGSE